MTREKKYIVVKQSNFEVVILFEDSMQHKDFKEMFEDNIVSAGIFCLYYNEQTKKIDVEVYGNSQSLHLDSRKQDAELIKKYLNHIY